MQSRNQHYFTEDTSIKTRPDLTIPSTDLSDICHTETVDDIRSDHKATFISVLTHWKIYHNRKPHWNFKKANWIKKHFKR